MFFFFLVTFDDLVRMRCNCVIEIHGDVWSLAELTEGWFEGVHLVTQTTQLHIERCSIKVEREKGRREKRGGRELPLRN